MYQVVDHPLAPFTTLAGDTKGPCVNVGVPTVNGAPIYVGEHETRSILKAFGWPAPEAHAEMAAERDAAVARVAEVEQRLVAALEQVAAYELIVSTHPLTVDLD